MLRDVQFCGWQLPPGLMWLEVRECKQVSRDDLEKIDKHMRQRTRSPSRLQRKIIIQMRERDQIMYVPTEETD